MIVVGWLGSLWDEVPGILSLPSRDDIDDLGWRSVVFVCFCNSRKIGHGRDFPSFPCWLVGIWDVPCREASPGK